LIHNILATNFVIAAIAVYTVVQFCKLLHDSYCVYVYTCTRTRP